MTTRVQITNPRDNKHTINVWKGTEHVAQLPPGDYIITHIWEGMDLLVKEVPNNANLPT